MEILVHDLPDIPQAWTNMPDRVILSPQQPIHPCEGCLGCWADSAGRCVIEDGYQDLASALSVCSHWILVSRCTYGTFSPFVKNVIDRSRGYANLHFQTDVGHRQHGRHARQEMRLSVYFYGDCTPEEMATARCTVTAMAVRMGLRQFGVQFAPSPDEWEEIG